ncbi:hemoglobin [Pseudoclavibacter chungangensis]|uniref:globin n=1 Tax=Pseudoclavibacter chungangensis TaxID=587635 RepID=UPI0015CCCAA9|nr:globin [Pseudoclavibacter chungangensis]NYJ67316.1 hemoglobin [Pseudoclavibacter chungangensis]
MSGTPIGLRGSDGRSALPTLYDDVGGMPTFERLVTAFYERVQHDEVLWPMYPQDDLEGAVLRLSTFLAQYFGGPTTYSDARGHPRLRMRHVAFHVNPDARDRWLRHMTTAVDELVADGIVSPMNRATMLDYFGRASTAMVNTFEPTPEPPTGAGASTGA